MAHDQARKEGRPRYGREIPESEESDYEAEVLLSTEERAPKKAQSRSKKAQSAPKEAQSAPQEAQSAPKKAKRAAPAPAPAPAPNREIPATQHAVASRHLKTSESCHLYLLSELDNFVLPIKVTQLGETVGWLVVLVTVHRVGRTRKYCQRILNLATGLWLDAGDFSGVGVERVLATVQDANDSCLKVFYSTLRSKVAYPKSHEPYGFQMLFGHVIFRRPDNADDFYCDTVLWDSFPKGGLENRFWLCQPAWISEITADSREERYQIMRGRLLGEGGVEVLSFLSSCCGESPSDQVDENPRALPAPEPVPVAPVKAKSHSKKSAPAFIDLVDSDDEEPKTAQAPEVARKPIGKSVMAYANRSDSPRRKRSSTSRSDEESASASSPTKKRKLVKKSAPTSDPDQMEVDLDEGANTWAASAFEEFQEPAPASLPDAAAASSPSTSTTPVFGHSSEVPVTPFRRHCHASKTPVRLSTGGKTPRLPRTHEELLALSQFSRAAPWPEPELESADQIAPLPEAGTDADAVGDLDSDDESVSPPPTPRAESKNEPDEVPTGSLPSDSAFLHALITKIVDKQVKTQVLPKVDELGQSLKETQERDLGIMKRSMVETRESIFEETCRIMQTGLITVFSRIGIVPGIAPASMQPHLQLQVPPAAPVHQEPVQYEEQPRIEHEHEQVGFDGFAQQAGLDVQYDV